MSVTCNKYGCDSGKIDLESLLVSLFAKDSNNCVGIKTVQLDETDCNNLSDLEECGMVVTLEQALKMAIVDDGCGGNALAIFNLSV